ncbi:hypothetical protein HDU99_003249, partial [Rhizoclosmatium hyalinum]
THPSNNEKGRKQMQRKNQSNRKSTKQRQSWVFAKSTRMLSGNALSTPSQLSSESLSLLKTRGGCTLLNGCLTTLTLQR